MTRFGHMFGSSLHDLVADILRAIHTREVATRDNGRGGRRTLYTVHKKLNLRWSGRRSMSAVGHPHTRENDRRRRQRLRIEAKRAGSVTHA